MTNKPKFDINAHVSTMLLELMEQHGTDWAKPWVSHASDHHNCNTKRRYSGMNVFLLSMACHNKNYSSKAWGTYNAWKKAGCVVKGGEKATIITQPKLVKIEKDGEDRSFTTFRGLPVFNLEQVEGDFTEAKSEELEGWEDHFEAETVLAQSKADVKHGGDRAYYSPAEDRIQLPPKDAFRDAAGYYGTALHELVHWTGHKDRLNRDFNNSFGTEGYAFEELIAEAGAAMLCVRAGVTPEPRPDHAKYLNSWQKAIKSKPNAAVTAFKMASKAANYIVAL